jgi:hypothetical protein
MPQALYKSMCRRDAWVSKGGSRHRGQSNRKTYAQGAHVSGHADLPSVLN